MAALVTRLQLVARARQLANMEAAVGLVTAAEINDWVNIELTDLYDMLVEASPPDYYSVDATPIAVVAGTVAYALPADFRSAQMVSVKTGATVNDLQPIPQIRDGQRGRMRAPSVASTVLLRYTPAPPTLTTDADPVTGAFDGVSGWADLIVHLLVRRMKAKESPQTLSPPIETRIAELRARITAHASKRNQGGIDYVTEVEDYDHAPLFTGYTLLAGYQLRAGYIDVYENRSAWP